MRRATFAAAMLIAFAAFAQGNDDFASFPGASPPPQKTPPPAPAPTPSPSSDFTPFPATPAQPQPSVPPPSKPRPAPAPAQASAPAVNTRPAAPAAKSPPPKTSGAPAEARIVSTQEHYLPGGEPHSPATWGLAIDDRRTVRQSPGAFGGIGLLHLSSADPGPKGVLRFAAGAESFATHDFPVRGALNVHNSGTFSVSFVPLSFLEAYLSYSASANTNSTSSPTLIQALGDVLLAVKASQKWAPGFYGGLELRAQSFSGVGNQDISRYAFGFTPLLLGLYDFRDAFPKVPLRLHANLGFALDGTGNLVSQFSLTAAEYYALGINRYNRFLVGVGLEAPLPGVTPFVEYNLGIPLGVDNGVLIAPNGSTETIGQAMPQKLGVGLKLTAFKDFTLFAAADFALLRHVAVGIPATPPFDFFFGASFAVDPFQHGETKLVETIRERPVEKQEAPKTGKVAGVVVDAKTKKPIPGVIVAMAGLGVPPVASDAPSGQFLTYELPSGHVKLDAQKDGYKEGTSEVDLEAGQTSQVELALEPMVKLSKLNFTVASKKKPVASTVKIEGLKNQTLQTTESNAAPVPVEVPAGKYTLSVTAPGFLAQTREVQISEGAEMAVPFELAPEPKRKLVIVKDNKIEISQQVHFASARATILADSFPLLDQVVDAIVKNDIKRLRIEGHTDNRGSKTRNQKLSEDRAKAVAEYLVKAGIDAARIEAVGFGDSRPIAPNLTARGRELNRRVEFIIVQH